MKRPSSHYDALLWVDPASATKLQAIAQKADEVTHGYYSYMFLDDFEHLAGYGFRASSRRFRLDTSEITEEVLTTCLQLDDVRPSVDRTLEELVQRIAQDIVLDGSSYWQLTEDTSWSDQFGQRRPVPFRLDHLPAWTIRKGVHGIYQIVPDEFATSRFRKNRRTLDRSRIFEFRIRGRPGRTLRRFTKFLRVVDQWGKRDHVLLSASLQGGARYDMVARGLLVGRAILARSRYVGWHARGLHKEGLIEPTYTAVRNLRFRKFQARCRQSIIVELNEMLREVGEKRGFKASISTPGLRSPEDFEELEREVYNGDSAIVDLMTAGPEMADQKNDSENA